MRVRDGEERERERRIQLRVYIQKKSNETHKRQKRLKSMGGDTREDHIQHTLYTPRDSRALSPRAPRKRGAQAADLSGSLGTVEGTRPEHAHTHRPPCRPHVAGAHVSGSGWRLPVCEKTFFSLTIAPSTPPTPPTPPTTPTPPTPPTPRGVQTESPWPNQRGCAVCLCDNLVRGERHGVRVCMYCTYLIL